MCERSKGQKIKIRRLSLRDYDKMVEIWRSSGLPFKPKGRESKASMKKQIEATPDLLLGAEENDELIGVIIASTEGRKGWLNRIAVVPEKRGKGIAKALTVKAEQALRKRGIKIIGLLVHKSNTQSINLAKSLGYTPNPEILYLTKRESDDA